MSMSDPIADMLIRIRNAQLVRHVEVVMPASKLKASIAQVLKQEGYIEDFALRDNGVKKELAIALKYYAGRPVIERLERVSKPGLRVYKGRNDIPRVMNGLGVAILSTSRGVMTDRKARAARSSAPPIRTSRSRRTAPSCSARRWATRAMPTPCRAPCARWSRTWSPA